MITSKKWLTDNQKEEIKSLSDENTKVKEVAKKVKAKHATVYIFMKRQGLPFKNDREQNKSSMKEKLSPAQVSRIIKAYRPNLTIYEISEICGIDYPRVSQVIKRRGLEPCNAGKFLTRVPLTDEQKKKIAKLATANTSAMEIANKINAKRGAVYAHLRTNGLPFRLERTMPENKEAVVSGKSFTWQWAKSNDAIFCSR